jgi:AraC-like DNA-binding protein
MAIFMDIHHVPGTEALDLAEAHRKDMLIQNEYQCKCKTYWLDETRGNAFCLIEAPDKSSVEEMHKNSHGLTPNKIIEVNYNLVEFFLGRIHDPDDAEISDSGLKVFSDSAFRILIVTRFIDPVLLRFRLSAAKADDLMNRQIDIIRKELSTHEGREVENAGSGFIASFSSAAQAVSCALNIQKNLPDAEKSLTGFKISVNAGEPISKSEHLFGDVIQLANCLCTVARNNQLIVSSVVKDLLAHDYFKNNQQHFITLSPQDENLVESLFNILEANWSDPDFPITEFCQSMSMSQSRLYRKTMALWELSPNILLKEFRLNKALELLKKRSLNIAQTTFDAGFNSPSYFAKCFKKKFGLSPLAYLNLLS